MTDKWISVSDDLPEVEEVVLIYVPEAIKQDKICVAAMCDWESCNVWHNIPQQYEPNEWAKDKVSHWMKLPSAPRGVSNEN